MARVEEDAEERVAQVAVDDLLERSARLADAQRAVPLGDRLEIRARPAARRSRRCPPAARRRLRRRNPARQLSAPQIPKATVNRSPRSIRRSPGLSRPSDARSPLVSIRWHESGMPFHSRSRDGLVLASSRARSPNSSCRTPCEVWHAAYSNAASCSTSLITRRPSAAPMSRSAAFSTDPLGPVIRRSSSTMNGGRLDRLAVGVLLPADDPDPAAGPDALVGQDLGQRPGAVARLAREG